MAHNHFSSPDVAPGRGRKAKNTHTEREREPSLSALQQLLLFTRLPLLTVAAAAAPLGQSERRSCESPLRCRSGKPHDFCPNSGPSTRDRHLANCSKMSPAVLSGLRLPL
ncbi:hypothetical protein ACQKWADRAFT_287752 [Trichoderma austrokoningii]